MFGQENSVQSAFRASCSESTTPRISLTCPSPSWAKKAGAVGHKMLAWGGILFLGLLQGACAGDAIPARGSLIIPYVLGNQLSCDDPQVGVKRIRARLNDEVYEQEVACGTPSEVRFDEVDAGQWQLTVEGLDANGVIVMDNRHQEALPVVEVLGDGTVSTAMPVELASVPAHVFLRWSEGFSDCEGLGIDRFLVSIWDTSGTTALMRGEISCATRPNAPQDYRRLEDPQRRIHGSTMQSLRVQAVNRESVPIGQPASFNLATPPGAGYSVLVSLDCGQDGCLPGQDPQIAS